MFLTRAIKVEDKNKVLLYLNLLIKRKKPTYAEQKLHTLIGIAIAYPREAAII